MVPPSPVIGGPVLLQISQLMFITVFDVIAEAKQMRLNNLPIHAVLACFVVQLSYAELVDLVNQQKTCIWFNSMPTVLVVQVQ